MVTKLKQVLFREFKKSETKHHELNYLFWECTTRCNLNCRHCGSDCSKDSFYKDMPLDDFLKALDTIESPCEHFTVVLTGGEPPRLQRGVLGYLFLTKRSVILR